MAQLKDLLVSGSARILGSIYGTVSNVTTTADTTNSLYLTGLTSSATTTLKRNTSISMTGGTITATTFSGNATSASKLATARTISATGDASWSISFDGSANKSAALTLASSGVTAGTYGPTAAATPGYGATFSVPSITVDAKGRVTSASTYTVKIPASDNSDTKVTQTASTTNANYRILLSANANDTSETNISYKASGIYANPSTSSITATSFLGTATNANNLLSNTRMDYGWNGVNYFNIEGTAGNAAKANDTPTTAWWHIMRFNHANAEGFYTDLAIPFNANSLYYKSIRGGAVANSGWVRVLDALNYNTYSPTLTGGNASGTWNISISGTAANASKTANSLVLKSNTGTTEGTDLYTFNGSAAKTLDLKSGTNVTLTAAAGSITFSSPSLSGGSAAAADATVVGGVTVSGHAVTVAKKTITAGTNISISGTASAITINNTGTRSIAGTNMYTGNSGSYITANNNGTSTHFHVCTWSSGTAKPTTTGQLGQIFIDTTNKIVYIWNGTAWEGMNTYQ